MAVEKHPAGSFEKELMNTLRFAKLEKDHLSVLVKDVASIQSQGFLKGIHTFPKGIPYPDGLEFHVVSDANNIAKLLEEISKFRSTIGAIRLFPYGIPYPEIYRVEVEMGY